MDALTQTHTTRYSQVHTHNTWKHLQHSFTLTCSTRSTWIQPSLSQSQAFLFLKWEINTFLNTFHLSLYYARYMLYPSVCILELLKRIDDSSKEVRIEALKTLGVWLSSLDKKYNTHTYHPSLEFLFQHLLLYLDDPDHEIQLMTLGKV